MRNEQGLVVGSKRGLKTKYHSLFLRSLLCSFTFEVQKTLLTLFCASNDIKNVQFGVEMKENLKVLSDKVPFVVYPNCNPIAT